MFGEALNLLVKGEDERFRIDEKALERVLGNREELAVVVSVAGPFRKGKSFLLDYCLRYLKSLGDLGPENKPLDGFSWRGGSERETTGLLAWTEIFPIKLSNGKKAGILLLDTQGAFDSHSTVRESASVFALSTLLSSVQVYNLSQNIQEDDLQHLQLFAEYGRVAAYHTVSAPFQRLVFLVRDWGYPYEAEYGSRGGKTIIERRLKISPNQHPELQQIRKHISSCFSDISCFLMPHPGLQVVTNRDFDGRLSDLDPTFKIHLKDFIVQLLSPENLLVKRIAGQEIKLKDLPHYFKCYMEVFAGDTLPEPKSILSATAEANHLSAVASAKDSYSKQMGEQFGSGKPYANPLHLETEHINIRHSVLQDFKNKPKMGSKEYSESYKEDLEHAIEELFHNFKHLNQAKNVYMTFLTPGLFLGCAVFFYLLSTLFGMAGLVTLSQLCNIFMGAYMIGTATWTYIRCTGELQDVGRWIDSLARILWDHIILPAYQAAIDKANT